MRTLLVGFLFAIMLAGCATQGNLPAQYLTLRILEEEKVTQVEALEWVERLRALLDYSVAVNAYELQTAINWDGMQPSTRLLVSAMVSDLSIEAGTPLEDRTREALLARLAAVEQAIHLY